MTQEGIDYSHPDFRNEDGSTRILALYDETLDREFTAEEINRALESSDERERFRMVPSRDTSGHGTHVAGIAAGNGRASGGVNRGVAYESPLLVVKLGTQEPNGFPRTTQLMRGLDYVVQKSLEYQMQLISVLEILMAPTAGQRCWKAISMIFPITGRPVFPLEPVTKELPGDIPPGFCSRDRNRRLSWGWESMKVPSICSSGNPMQISMMWF